ncbi:MAG: class I SAM-dependent methyltransferase [Cyanobacteria bacterium P01_H01_bin.15]
MSPRNLRTYQATDIVGYYSQIRLIQGAEKQVIERLQAQLPQMRMLDMGVGGGRTTTCFAPLVKDYIGIDNSPPMIAACQQRFSDWLPLDCFRVVDARDLSPFADNSFDFILFSYNGLDFVSHAERVQVLQEIQRVGKPGAYFCFSSHHLGGIERAFSFREQLSFNPISVYLKVSMWGLLRLFNHQLNYQDLMNSEHVIVRDESHNFRLDTYYIRPAAQIVQLTPGFRDVEVYSWRTGEQLDAQAQSQNTDMWLYYLCQVAE